MFSKLLYGGLSKFVFPPYREQKGDMLANWYSLLKLFNVCYIIIWSQLLVWHDP